MVLEGAVDVSQILRSGVYALCAKGAVIYVGKAKGLYSRIYTHKNLARKGQKGQKIPSWLPVKGFVFDEVFVWPCRLEEIDRLEAEKINKYKPRYNESLKNGLKVKAPIELVIGGKTVTLNRPREEFHRRV